MAPASAGRALADQVVRRSSITGISSGLGLTLAITVTVIRIGIMATIGITATTLMSPTPTRITRRRIIQARMVIAGYRRSIDQLENEVDRLRQEREARESSASQSRSKSDSEKTELVFRDKHVEEVQNYAIVGQTLWILSGQRARKIPLDQLDIPATKKANDDRGVDFQLPG